MLIKPAANGRTAEAAMSWPQSIREFEALVDALGSRLVHFAFCRLHSAADAEDVVQDVLVQAYRDRERRKGVDNAIPFLFRMVANRSTDVLRRRKRAPGPLEEVPAPAPGADSMAEAAARQRRAEALLAGLPAAQAEAIRLRVYGELPFEAVARIAGCSVPTVKSRFRYGIEKLRRALERQGGSK